MTIIKQEIPEKKNMEKILKKILDAKKILTDKNGFDYGENIPKKRICPVLKPDFSSGQIICEIKRGSPSEGKMKEISDPVKLATEYKNSGAGIISILTEKNHFYGSLCDISDVKKALPEIPVLRKDFITDIEEVEVSYRVGADMVLLIASIFIGIENGKKKLTDIHDRILHYGMTPLVEIHSEEEYDFIKFLSPEIVGINSRNLKTFKIDRKKPHALIEKMDCRHVIFESGIRNYNDAFFAASSGFSGLLIGTSIIKSDSPFTKIKEILSGFKDGRNHQNRFYRRLFSKIHNSKRSLIKICGLTCAEDLNSVIKHEPDMLGFILAESPRRITQDKLRELSCLVPSDILKVAVITEKQLNEGISAVENGYADCIQIHGQVSKTHINVPWYRAYNIKNIEEFSYGNTPFELYDAFVKGRYGGTGKTLSPEIINHIKEKTGIFGLAGGITPENVAYIVNKYNPALVDICSGLESKPGKKDIDKIEKFFCEIKNKEAIMQQRQGYYGEFGGAYIPEILRPVFEEINTGFKKYKNDESFISEFESYLKHFVGRPTPLMYASNASREIGGADIYLKLEGLANTGAHKINNALGQALLAKKLGKKRVIAETGAGQHGVATASICAKLGLECEIFMGAVDVKRQHPNVFWMELFGAKVHPVENGTKTLKDAVNEAFREWTKSPDDTYYLIGSALGAAPYPEMVKYFQSVISREVVKQISDFEMEKPDMMIACVGGGSNSMGFFSEFLTDEEVRLVGVEAGGLGIETGHHASRMCGNGTLGIIQGYKSYFLQDKDGQILPTHSISAGLDYAGIGPELAYNHQKGRIEFSYSTDEETIKAFRFFARHEGIIAALESSHALAEAIKRAESLGKGRKIIVNVSGRGEKDLFITAKAIDGNNWIDFLKNEVE